MDLVSSIYLFNLLVLLIILMFAYFIVFTDEELNNLLDRSDMIQSKSIDTKSTAEHYKILATS